MNILHVIPSVNAASGGPIEGVKQIAAVAVAEGHQVEVASMDAAGDPWVQSFPLPVHACGPAILHPYSYAPRFKGWLRENAPRFEAIVVNGLWAYHSFGTWRALRQSKTPYVVFPHGMLDPWFKRQYPMKHLKKWLYWPWAEYRVLRDASSVVFTCEEEKLLARESFWLYRCNEVTVGYGTSEPQGDPEHQIHAFFSRFPQLRSRRLALFMGRIHPKKGCDLAIQAFAKVLASNPAWNLVIAGPDQIGWQRQLISQSEALGIGDRITWAGMLSGDDKWGAMRASEIFLLPSHQENFGIAVAEALACGVPALISRQVNIWREIQEDGAGLVAKDDLAGTCELLRGWEMLAAHERDLMRARARQCFARRFEVRKASLALYGLLDRIRADFQTRGTSPDRATVAPF